MKRIFLILCIAALMCMTELASADVTTVGPVANFTANTTSGPAPLTVQFTDISTMQLVGHGTLGTEQTQLSRIPRIPTQLKELI